MSLTPEEVRRLAGLAGLELSPDEVQAMAAELAGVLAHMAALRRADRAPARPGGGGSVPLRDDVVVFDPLAVPPAAFAPEWRDGLFLVPRAAAPGQDADGAEGE